ncbi:MAG: hypothetical protein LBL34_01590 [Clostridiales bacterium]|jgi:hypothetical protein|nr:hypothetical protein [Clostridiales bacterium]
MGKEIWLKKEPKASIETFDVVLEDIITMKGVFETDGDKSVFSIGLLPWLTLFISAVNDILQIIEYKAC